MTESENRTSTDLVINGVKSILNVSEMFYSETNVLQSFVVSDCISFSHNYFDIFFYSFSCAFVLCV